MDVNKIADLIDEKLPTFGRLLPLYLWQNGFDNIKSGTKNRDEC